MASILDALQVHNVDVRDGVIAPKCHEPIAEQNDFIDTSTRVALLEVSAAERLRLHLVEPREQSPRSPRRG